MADETCVPVGSEVDIVTARQRGRLLAQQVGLRSTEATLVATAISELARNILEFAKRGEILLQLLEEGGRRGIEVTARDEGPGIADIQQALRDGYSSAGSLGLGLPGARRLMDEMEISSEPGRGTTVTVRKWVR